MVKPIINADGKPRKVREKFKAVHGYEAKDEPKEKKFKRLAERRVKGVLKALRQLGNLGAYPHTLEQKEYIFATVEENVIGCASKFDAKTKAEDEKVEIPE